MKRTKKVFVSVLGCAMALSMMPSIVHAQENIIINEENFPDPNFRVFLETLSEGEDGIFTPEEIEGITDLSYDGFSATEEEKLTDVSGIEYFTSLEYLDLSGNNIETLRVTSPVLVDLDCYENKLTSLTVTSPVLEWLDCHANQLTTLEANSAVLDYIDCSNNYLTSLDLTPFESLTFLDANCNVITSLDTSANPLLEEVHYIPRETKMDVKTDFDYTKVPTMDAYLQQYEDFLDISTDGLTIDLEKKTISLQEGVTSATLTLVLYDEYRYEYTFYYEDDQVKPEPPVEPEKPNVEPEEKPEVEKPDVEKPEQTPIKPEEKPMVEEETKSPQTSDASHMGAWMSLMLVAGAAGIMLEKRRKA